MYHAPGPLSYCGRNRDGHPPQPERYFGRPRRLWQWKPAGWDCAGGRKTGGGVGRPGATEAVVATAHFLEMGGGEDREDRITLEWWGAPAFLSFPRCVTTPGQSECTIALEDTASTVPFSSTSTTVHPSPTIQPICKANHGSSPEFARPFCRENVPKT